MSTATDHQDRIQALRLAPAEKRRIRIAAECPDCRDIPKVPEAGHTFAGPERNYQLMHNGVKVIEDGYCGRWMTELIRLLGGHHEPQEERVFHELLQHVSPGGTMLELGSYWAYYSLWFQRQIADARLCLIEPDPRNLEVGQGNFSLNEATGRFFHSCIGRRSRSAEPFSCDDGMKHSVPQTCVDDFLTQNDISQVDILLSDIQGAELDMLEGAARSIDQGKIRFLILSTHHHSISNDPLTHQKCLQLLQKRKSYLLAEHTVAESYSGDGLIVAAFRPEDRQLPPIEISHNRPSNSLFRETEYDLADAWEKLGGAAGKKPLRHAVANWLRRCRRWVASRTG